MGEQQPRQAVDALCAQEGLGDELDRVGRAAIRQ